MIDEKLEAYSEMDYYPFHMPGHKRHPLDFKNPYEIDITEIPGFDNLHEPTEDLLELEKQWAQLYGAKEAFVMVNGSTGGNLTAMFSALEPGGELLMARNCHSSVYRGAYLKNVKVHYIYPELISVDGGEISGKILPEDLEKILDENPKIQVFLLTSPTYEGIISDIENLVKIAHTKGVKVIVDCAHGAHFGLFDSPYQNPITLGADLVVLSLHKTLPAFTSTALLLKGKDSQISTEKIRFYLDCFETSSPSYVLVSSVAKCYKYLEKSGKSAFVKYRDNLNEFYKETKGLNKLKILSFDDMDKGKLLISTGGYLTGPKLAEQLREDYHIETEMSCESYCLAMTSIMDTKEGFCRLSRALLEIDAKLSKSNKKTESIITYPKPISVMSMKEAIEGNQSYRNFENSKDCVSAGFVGFYPPGIPILTPGELITGEILRIIKAGMEKGLIVTGLEDRGILIVD